MALQTHAAHARKGQIDPLLHHTVIVKMKFCTGSMEEAFLRNLKKEMEMVNLKKDSWRS